MRVLVLGAVIVCLAAGDAAASRGGSRKAVVKPSGERRTVSNGRGKVRVEISFGRRAAGRTQSAAARAPRPEATTRRASPRRERIMRRVEPWVTPATLVVVMAARGPLVAALIGGVAAYGTQQALRWAGRRLDARRSPDRP